MLEALHGLRRVSLAVRPTEEPESPANSMFAITFVFVIFAFVVPILLLGMKSENTDIAGADVPWLAPRYTSRYIYICVYLQMYVRRYVCCIHTYNVMFLGPRGAWEAAAVRK